MRGSSAMVSHVRGLMWGEGLRAFLCMVPMIVMAIFGQASLLVSLGVGGFFYSTISMPPQKGKKLLTWSLLTALGLGYYLMGGHIVFNPWLATVFTFFVTFNIGILSAFPLLGLLALQFISIYATGLNAPSPDAIHSNFFAFILAFGWAGLVSVPFNWRVPELPTLTHYKAPAFFMAGIRLGLGVSIALVVSYLFGFVKMGWATSGAGLVIGLDLAMSRQRVWRRLVATLVGSLIAVICFIVSLDLTFLMIMTVVFTVLNGLYRERPIGKMPLFFTTVLLILYSLQDPAGGTWLSVQRVAYNVVGIFIASLLIMYPFPRLTQRFEKNLSDLRL